MKLISATDLIDWANTKDSQQYLPHLIRKLIFAYSNSIKCIYIPVGDSTFEPGFDGIVEQYDDIISIPLGLSIWECGTDARCKSKAESDYKKRSEQTDLSINRSDSTFVFVTPRRFPTKNKWIENKKKDMLWKDICVIEANTLELLLENNPAVSIWFAREHLGKNISLAIYSLDSYWNEIAFSNKINKPMLPDVFLAGREAEVINLCKLLDSSNVSNVIFIKSNSIDESIAFIYGALNSGHSEKRDEQLAKCIVVKTENDFKEIINANIPQIILIRFNIENNGLINSSTAKKHIILVPCDDQATITPECQNIINLGIIDNRKFINKLEESGFSKKDSLFLARQSAFQFSIFRRHAGMQMISPEWGEKQNNYVCLLPLLLVGAWDNNSAGDKELLSEISKQDYNDYLTSLNGLKYISDAPVFQIGSYYRASSSYDLWANLAKYVTSETLLLFRQTVLKICNEIDPALELDPDKRFMASMFNKSLKYSSAIKAGILETLLIISKNGDSFNGILFNGGAQNWCDFLIAEILNCASKEFWQSNYSYLQVFAEISPSSFLKAIKDSLKDPDMPIMVLFNNLESSWFVPKYHCNLLWALEGIAFLPAYLSQSCSLLVDLCKLDPGVKMVNKPINSLVNIFNPRLPQNSSTFEDMFEVIIASVSNRNSEVAWKLCMDSLHFLVHGVSISPNYRPKWTQILDPHDRIIMNNELAEYIDNIFDLLLTSTNLTEKKLAKLLEISTKYDIARFNKVALFIEKNTENINHTESLIYKKIRRIINLNLEHPDAEWALQVKYIKKLENLKAVLYPKDLLTQAVFNFENTHLLVINDHTRAADTEIVQNLYLKNGLDGIIALIKHVSRIYDLPLACKDLIKSKKEWKILYKLLESKDKNELIFIQTLIYQMSIDKSAKWLKNQFNKILTADINLEGQANFLLSLQNSNVVYVFIDSLDMGLQELFWQKVNIGINNDINLRVYLIHKLVSVGRYFAILRSFSFAISDIKSDIILKILYLAGTQDALDKELLDRHMIYMIFSELDKRNDFKKDQLVQLEWLFLPILCAVGSTRTPKLLHDEMAKSPSLFMDAVCAVYKSDNEEINMAEAGSAQENSKDMAYTALALLESWKVIPGTIESHCETQLVKNYDINYELLIEWITIVREIALAKGRSAIVDILIGKVFANSPKDNGLWPHKSICKVIDEIDSDYIAEGIITGVHNKRGVHVVDDGDSELKFKDQYIRFADGIKNTYPLVAEILRKIANNFLQQANYNKLEAQIRQRFQMVDF